jgi:hypothetical protein
LLSIFANKNCISKANCDNYSSKKLANDKGLDYIYLYYSRTIFCGSKSLKNGENQLSFKVTSQEFSTPFLKLVVLQKTDLL